MHDRRRLKMANTDRTLKVIQKTRSRKQIGLCKRCDMKVDKGEYDGAGIY
jgi:hypothetical protein